jgi:hypothetical protein
MLRLKKILKTNKVTVIKLEFNGEKYLFNLDSEIAITKENLDGDIITQPRSYAFLSVLHKKLIAKAKNLEVDMNRIYSKVYYKYLTSTDTHYYKKMSSYPTTTVAKELAMKDLEYIEICRAFIKAEEDRDIAEVCVKAFEQRAFLLQTLSANQRKERN